MLNNIPILGWILDVIFKVSLAIPFWLCWTVWDIGEKYFYFLPEVYTNIPFWSIVGIFICLGILKGFSPFSISSSSTGNKTENKDNN